MSSNNYFEFLLNSLSLSLSQLSQKLLQKKMSSPIGVSTPTINDQEFPDNSLLNYEFDSLISNSNLNYHSRLDDFDFTKDDNVSPISIGSVISHDYANNSLVAFENLLPDYLTNDDKKEENSLKKEYETLLKMN